MNTTRIACRKRRPIRRTAAAVLIALVTVPAVATPASAGKNPKPQPPVLAHLHPGQPVRVVQQVPVNVVFVGLEEGAAPTRIDLASLLAAQPSSAIPRVRSQIGLPNLDEPLGVEYRYDVNPVFADAAFEDAFFGFLVGSAFGPFAPTVYQDAYSAQSLAAQQITENWVLDATAVESWLIEHAQPLLGVDASRPTVFFINWFGRADFRFHTYAYFAVQPEIGLFPPNYDFAQTNAWGGGAPDHAQSPTSSLGRVWFLDLSAGPEWGSSNWYLEVPDFNGDGVVENRLPPIWEYGTDHWYRPFLDLSGDLAKVLRFVALDMLFTPSPIYEPSTTSLLADTLELDLNVVADTPHDPFQHLLVDEVLRRLDALDPSRTFVADVDSGRFVPSLRRAYNCYITARTAEPEPCYPAADHGDPFFDLWLWSMRHGQRLLDGVRGEIPILFFDVRDGYSGPLAGMAWADRLGRQSWVHAWSWPADLSTGRSPTKLVAHEVGHYLGVPHPHDGYDPASGLQFNQSGDTYFAWLGDNVASVMSYNDTQPEFSQFDRDNVDRWLTIGRMQAANDLLRAIYRSPRAASATAELLAADALAGTALTRLEAWDLRGASVASLDAYHAVLAAADKVGVRITHSSAVVETAGAGLDKVIDSDATSWRPTPNADGQR
jgi:hypothetical protein